MIKKIMGFIPYLFGFFLFILSCAGLWKSFDTGDVVLGLYSGGVLFAFIMLFDVYFIDE